MFKLFFFGITMKFTYSCRTESDGEGGDPILPVQKSWLDGEGKGKKTLEI